MGIWELTKGEGRETKGEKNFCFFFLDGVAGVEAYVGKVLIQNFYSFIFFI